MDSFEVLYNALFFLFVAGPLLWLLWCVYAVGIRKKDGYYPLVNTLCTVPAYWMSWRYFNGEYVNGVEEPIRFLGDWALRLLVVVLAITPLRRFFNWPRLLRYRRAIGVWSFAYALSHVTIFVAIDQGFDWSGIFRQMIMHKFILVGMLCLLILLPLAITSTNGWMRRLKLRWKQLHRLVYLAVPLAVLHYFWMIKAGWREPAIYAGLVAIALGLRLWWRFGPGAPARVCPAARKPAAPRPAASPAIQSVL